MENELEINLDDLDQVQNETDRKLQIKDRFAKLSEKMTLTAREKETAEAKAKTEEDSRLKTEKERDFYKDFSQVSAKYPQASQHQDKILERVNKGYSAKDATLAVLDEVGQLQPITAETNQPQNIAGGSASTGISDTGSKELEDTTKEEKRNALIELEKQGVNILKF